MKNYELAYLITPNLSDTEAKTLSEKITGFIPELGGITLNNPNLEKRKLAYPINKKIEAFLVSLEFSLLPEKIKDLEKKIISENQVLRHIIVTKAKEKKRIKKTRKPIDSLVEKKEEDMTKEKKVEIEKISEKIDEILK